MKALGRAAGEGCCRGLLVRAAGEGCWRGLLARVAGEGCWRGLLASALIEPNRKCGIPGRQGMCFAFAGAHTLCMGCISLGLAR